MLTGWGRTGGSWATVAGPLNTERLQELVAGQPHGGVLARGAGRSYGDAAQNAGGYVLAPVTGPGIEPAAGGSTVRVSASTSFTELLVATVPHGLIVPVLPGTRHLTVGGAIAADVHGKNQRTDGSFCSWVDQIELIDGHGELRVLTPDGTPEEFRATAGGMGLTGIIVAATIRLLPLPSTRLQVTSTRVPGLDEVLAAMNDSRSKYAVAWIDTTATGRSLGRGIVDTADHLDPAGPPSATGSTAGNAADDAAGRLDYWPGRAHRAPRLPFCPVTPLAARRFNGLWYARAAGRSTAATSLPDFFHRLDALAGWNRLLGPRGFVQYQFAVPAAHDRVIAEVLEAVQRARCAPFLGTLKRFGPGGAGHLSFPQPGWSLAVDMPARPRLRPLLAELDERVAAAGGRVYLAKDARLSGAALAAMYDKLPEWQAVRAKLDPDGVFRSDLGRRVGLC
jgi:decaprenylphospho-beta-D-ribofuranose 2-oxidase